MAFLKVKNGPEANKRYELTQKEYVLGRHPDCDIIIDVGAVSRMHCRLTSSGNRYLLEDLGARNFTYRNETQLQPHVPVELDHLDQIRVCDVVFTFHDASEASTPSQDSWPPAVLVDDESSDSDSSKIMSKLDVRSSVTGSQVLVASSEAKLKALIEITQSLGNALSLDKVLPQVLDSLFRIFVQADRGFIGLVDGKGVLIPKWTKLRRENSDETIRVSRTIAKQVMETKEAILSADAANDSRFEMSQSVADFRIRSMMCAPLIDSEGKAFGILQIDTLDQRQRFQESDLELLAGAASQASIAIENARLHEEVLRQRVLARDIELAREVQQAFLPSGPPHFPGYEFFSFYRAANHIGGDYYDYVPLPQGRLAVVVADVVGHGVAAAMLMAKLSAEMRFCLASEPDAATAVTTLNQRLCQLDLNRFVTLVMVVIDPEMHRATIVNAGHMAPLYRRADGAVEEPSKAGAGLPIGIIANTSFAPTTITLAPGESLTLYTDGLNEATDAAHKQYTIERLKGNVKAAGKSPREIGQLVMDGVQTHLAGGPQNDDMCLVVVQRN